MTTIRHAMNIAAPRDRVFASLTDVGELAKWHRGTVSGEVKVGSLLKLESKPGLTFSWETTELVDDAKITQTCIDGPGSTDKQVTFELFDTDGGGTRVLLSDGDWDENDPNMPFCNTHWGIVLGKLKWHVEGG